MDKSRKNKRIRNVYPDLKLLACWIQICSGFKLINDKKLFYSLTYEFRFQLSHEGTNPRRKQVAFKAKDHWRLSDYK